VVAVVVGVVLAGGEGLRLKPLTRKTPKALVKLAGRPLYHYSLAELEHAGVRETLVVAPPGRGGHFTLARRVIEQPEPGRLDAAVKVALEEARRLGASTLVMAFTGFLSAPRGMVRSAMEFYSSSGFQAVISVVPVATGLETYGFVELNPSGEVRSVRPPGGSVAAGAGYVFGGVLVASMRVAEDLAGAGFYVGLDRLASEGVLGGIVWHGDWVEIGYPWDFLEASQVALQLVQPVIDPNASIGRGVIVEGRVSVEAGAKIKPGAVIEGPAYIGEGVVVGANSHVESSLLEKGVSLGCCTLVRGTVILDRSTIGSHAVLERSVIGPSARVGSYFMVEAGKPRKVPSRLAGLDKILRKTPAVGVIIGEEAEVQARFTGAPGEVIS
jgi:NDP-sugar pyrophosphorylase family protein